MFIRITVEVRRNEHLAKGDPKVVVQHEFTFADDLVGEMQAADAGHKTVDGAIDRLVAQERRRA